MATSDLFSPEPGPTPAPVPGAAPGATPTPPSGPTGSDPPPADPPASGGAAVAEAAAAGRSARSVVQPGSPIRTLFTLFLKMQLTRTRVIGLSLAGLVGVLVAVALHNASRLDPTVG